MRVLVTNDDGIDAEGIQALRRALRELDDVEVHVVAPDSNRSAPPRAASRRARPSGSKRSSSTTATAASRPTGRRSTACASPTSGLLGEKPDLIVSGINHGSNLGDDVTYSGTVAAAFEGIILGIPAIAISLQSAPRARWASCPGRTFDFGFAASLAARLVEKMRAEPMPEGTLLNVNVPAGEPKGLEITKLGKRLYNDEMKLVEEDSEGRRRYRIYGFEPSFEDEPGTDLAAVARQGGAHPDPLRPDPPRRPRRARRLGHGRPPRRRDEGHPASMSADPCRTRRRAPAHPRVPQRALLRKGRPRDRGRRVRRPDRRASRARGRAPRASDARVAHPASRRHAALALRGGRAPRADALARERPLRRGHARLGEPHREPPQALRHHRGRDLVRDRAEDRRPRDLAHLRERQARSAARRAATGASARTSPTTS